MARVVFYEKPGCGTNARQKERLKAAGHEVGAPVTDSRIAALPAYRARGREPKGVDRCDSAKPLRA